MTKLVATHVGNNRLLKLAQHLRQVPTKSFNMMNWLEIQPEKGMTYGLDVNGEDFEQFKKVKNVNECGFAACAVGHAYEIKAFRRAGLTLAADYCGVEPRFNGFEGFDAAASFFAIDYAASTYLFSPDSYEDKVKPKAVAKVIEKFVAKRQAQK